MLLFKKTLAILLTAILILGGISTVFAADEAKTDSEYDLSDLMLLRRYLAGWNVNIETKKFDFYGNEIINLKNLMLLRRYLAGWDINLKPNNNCPDCGEELCICVDNTCPDCGEDPFMAIDDAYEAGWITDVDIGDIWKVYLLDRSALRY